MNTRIISKCTEAVCYHCHSRVEVSDFTMCGARYIDGECPVCHASNVLEPVPPEEKHAYLPFDIHGGTSI